MSNPGRYRDALFPNLHLWTKKNGHQYWIYRFMINGNRKDMSLGPLKKISLDEARELAVLTNKKVKDGINPIRERKKQKQINTEKLVTFKSFALEYIEQKKPEWSNTKHANQWMSTLNTHVFPVIGDLNLEDIETKHILKILSPIWETTTHTAFRLRGRLERILARATALNLRTGVNPAQWQGHLQELLNSPSKINPIKHHPALSFKEIPAFMEELSNQDSLSALALEFTILNACRTSEVLLAKRQEIEGSTWIIPAERMKSRIEHRIPLTQRTQEIIETVTYMNPTSDYIFSNKIKPLSQMAMMMVLRKLRPGFTVHGFRSTFRDWVSEETHHSPEVAEMALAHTIKNKVESAYRRGDLFNRRFELMKDWEQYCLKNIRRNKINL